MSLPTTLQLRAINARIPAPYFYGVTTTRIFCRTTCPARRPKPNHIRIFFSAKAAKELGFRSCKRCHPNSGRNNSLHNTVNNAKTDMLENSPPSIASLARKAGLHPSAFTRTFREVTGLGPKAYLTHLQALAIEGLIDQGASVTDAIFGAGFQSASAGWKAAQHLPVQPSLRKRGSASLTIRFATDQFSLGFLLIAATERGVCALFFGDETEELMEVLRKRFPRATLIEAKAELQKQLEAAIHLTHHPDLSAPFTPAETRPTALPLGDLDLMGTDFQVRVWRATQAIPPGKTRSYAELARAAGSPKAVRATGQALGQNPVAIAVPCHRVISSQGQLTGYRWGEQRKKALLQREGHRFTEPEPPSDAET